MASYNNNRNSTFSTLSGPTSSSQQVSTTTLLNALHTSYQSGQPLVLESSTSLVVNTWLTASNTGPDGRYGGTVDVELGRKAWEHARRRAEDACVILGSLHESIPSLFAPFVSALPISVPSAVYTALQVLRPFTHCVTPTNPSLPRHSSLSATFALSLDGDLASARLALSTSGIDTQLGLLNVPDAPGHRAFDVFYYLNSSSASQAERDALDLRAPSAYSLLNRSGTYHPPTYLPTADDAAAAEDFRANLKSLGIRGPALRNLISTLAGLLKLGDTLGYLVDEDVLVRVCDDAADLLDVDAEVLRRKCDTVDREALIAGVYEALVDWVVARANEAIKAELAGIEGHGADVDLGDSVSITVVEIPGQMLGKAAALKTVFDDSDGINLEMKEDGVLVESAGSSVLREVNNAVAECGYELGMRSDSAAHRDRDIATDRREAVLEKVAHSIDDDSFLKSLLLPTPNAGILLGTPQSGRFDLSALISSSRVWFHLCLYPTDDLPASLTTSLTPWSAGAVSRQLRTWRLPEWATRRNRALDYTADFDVDEFVARYARLGCLEGKDGVESWIMERGWSNGEVYLGHERVWIRESAWWEAESMLDLKLNEPPPPPPAQELFPAPSPGMGGNGYFGNQFADNATLRGSREDLMRRQSSATGLAKSIAPTTQQSAIGDYGLGSKGDEHKGVTFGNDLDAELGQNRVVEARPITAGRRFWVGLVWALTFWIPSPALRYIGRMKRPDVRLAWREKVVLMFIIFLLNGIVVFYIIQFGKLLCPNWNKAWDKKEVGYHQGDDDFWVSHAGKVYDLSKFWRIQHSDTAIETTKDNMQPFGGVNMDSYIRPPLTIACPNLVTDTMVKLDTNETLTDPSAAHTSGPTYQTDPTTALHDINWYTQSFLPRMKEFYKGDLVIDKNFVKDDGKNNNHQWVIIDNSIYDLTDYFYTQKRFQGRDPRYNFLDPAVEDLVKNNPGEDITDRWIDKLNRTTKGAHKQCFDNYFYAGKTDFRKTPKCEVQNYILLAFTVVLASVILTKFLAALQLGSKRRPEQQDKFVICQVPAYTEGEDQLRKSLDSLTALAYDNKRKLITVICDGMIVGGGNDRPTPKIVLDILGVDPKTDPPALPFKSVGNGSEQLNYGKVYSGLYEYEGNVVPYLVVVKVGKESEQRKTKPGNRGKRDSQVLLMSFLNRVHHRAPMSPLELEMYHQINNIIGVDPELYEYLLMVDADTMVKEDSLNRLVASCANDAKIAGICGETSLENEERSWWTMIQVYEYYISHHLAKAFESLFGSVTCLPGCFCMYRIRTADKGKPLVISDNLIREYADCEVDTLHKKNLLALGEDRYLTTLMTKYFPHMSYRFVPDAYAQTAAPETWSVLLSQRRRWINSTIHNLAELMFLKDLCGFCCFSMRFVVILDLFGTIILPATCAYLAYLIYVVATGSGPFPLISIILLAAVYGLQAIIFIIKRQWQHIGWMIIYLLAFPIYSFVLPVYSFWKQDDFSWGNTRIVVAEKGTKQVVSLEDEHFDPRSIPLQRWDDYADQNGLPGRRGIPTAPGTPSPFEKFGTSIYEAPANHHTSFIQPAIPMNPMHHDDLHSVYSSVPPASTILTSFPPGAHVAPATASPVNPFASTANRQSTYSFVGNQDVRQSTGNLSDHFTHMQNARASGSQADLLGPSRRSTPGLGGMGAMGMGGGAGAGGSPYGGVSRPVSTVNFQNMANGPTNEQIAEAVRECLREVDLDTVTKKQLKALAEQRLQTALVGEKKVYLDGVIDYELANM
ncbi:chitin synthase [Eremomyces bilateralis CBS 781.70]|uniref:chitin synthase n=1 Tax=Eremomyces bilateralis CBS 781.70 TaxID=1392243 RepID=A0A6G1G0J9_9PEZI|nr:chitin synthase [Eremomyces bilateralis CBS 781.70]KAF1811637.1 chitin synthase [Eremomyces bilateralis CBS 781.70]